ALSTAQTDLLPYYTACMTEVGIGTRSYLDVQAQQAAVSGGIDVYTSMRNKVGTEQDVQGYLVLSSKALYRKQQAWTQLLHDTLQNCRFDETARLHELMQQILGRKEQSITQHGHSLAMGAACSRMSPLAWLGYQSGGLEGIRQLKRLVKSLDDPEHLHEFASRLADTHRAVLEGKPQFLLIAEENAQDTLLEDVRGVWQGASPSAATPAPFTLPPLRERTEEAWLTSTQVNFC